MRERELKADRASRRPTRVRSASSATRLFTATALGLIAGAGTALVGPWQLSVLTGWFVAGGCFVAWVWWAVRRFNGGDTQRHATREDGDRASTDVVLVAASVVSLVGVALDLVKASQSAGPGKFLLTLVAIGAVAASWGVVHTVFALRYARQYYTAPVGGIDFKTKSTYAPNYSDFAYVAFTVGMTFQVSDTDIQANDIRRTVLRHALLAYLFGAVILAVTVNVIAGILQ